MNSTPRFAAGLRALIPLTTLPVAVGLRADAISFNNQASWASELGGADITVLHFNGADEVQNRTVDHPTLAAFYSGLGVDFLPYEGASPLDLYPVIYRNQQGQIAMPGHDGLLTNLSSPNQDQAGRAILFNFNREIRAVGAYSNNIDRGTLEAYAADGTLLGQALIGHDGFGGFGGIVTTIPIAHVKLINTYNSDLRWGIYDLQFSQGIVPTNEVPDAGSTLMLGALSLGALALFRRRF